MDDLFDRIISGEIPSEKVYEDEYTLAFLDINPNNPGHTLVVPKVHSTNILDITEEDWRHLMETVRKITPAVRDAVGATGVNVYMNNDASAFQVIFHTHIHIIPRHDGDGFEPWKGTLYKEGEAKRIAEQIKDLL